MKKSVSLTEVTIMSQDPRISHGRDILSQQDTVTAHGTDKHGGYHDYVATNQRDAERGLRDEIADANDDDE